MNSPIPVTVITGFLGAGKTTLLLNLIEQCHDRELVIVVNEFSERSIDDKLLQSGQGRLQAANIHTITDGLIGYGSDGQFLTLMNEIASRTRPVDHVFVETSGLALPTAIMEALANQLKRQFVLDATLAVIDTPLLLQGKFSSNAHDQGTEGASEQVALLFKQQIESADIVVLNKIDSLAAEDLHRVELSLREEAPGVRFVELAYDARLNEDVVIGVRLHEASFLRSTHRLERRTSAFNFNGKADGPAFDGHTHSGMDAHDHGLATHKHIHSSDPGWLSFVLSSRELQHESPLLSALEKVAFSHSVFRLKGFVHTNRNNNNNAGRLLVQGVRSRIIGHPLDKDCASSLRERDDESILQSHRHDDSSLQSHRHDESSAQSHHHDSVSHWHHHNDGIWHTHASDGVQATKEMEPAVVVPKDSLKEDHSTSEIVFIGYHLDRQAISVMLSEITGSAWY